MSASASIVNPTPAGGGGTLASYGSICIGGGHFGRHIHDIYSGTAGTFGVVLDLTDLPYPVAPGDYSIAVMAGERWYWQCWYRDPAAGTGASNFSAAVSILFE